MKSESYKETRRKRYLVYRKLGYNSKTATALSQRSLDVSDVEISEKTGKLKRNKKTKAFIENLSEYKASTYVESYNERIKDIKNDTVYTRHGMLTHDDRYKGENGRIIQIIKNENKLTTNQAYYFFYHMTTNGLSYKETRSQLLSNKEFEMYEKRKQAGQKTYIEINGKKIPSKKRRYKKKKSKRK